MDEKELPREINTIPPVATATAATSFFMADTRNILLVILVIVLFFSLFQINILAILGNLIQSVLSGLVPQFTQFLSYFGYSTGVAINKTSDLITTTTKGGLDIANGAVQNVGNLLTSSGQPLPEKPACQKLENTVQTDSKKPASEPKPDTSENPIQKPITSDKNSWCLIGEYENKRGCVAVTDSDKCMSGQIFPTQAMCLNPTLSP
jgi:hypothetical protein